MSSIISKCVMCGSEDLSEINYTMEHKELNKVLVIENIPAIQCNQCNEIYLTPNANRYIDKQLSIFRSGGFDNRAKEVSKNKGITQEELGKRIGVTKQRINQIFKDNNLDVQTMIKVSSAIGEPVSSVFKFKIIHQENDKFYLK
ncbi:helix-turn-helix domain-containing protein [Paenibacillus illinoisensis]|uniref:helix-turn-helix domain-containing protein n=2 Tax=Paenibacillus illinoisensis TaxID=59845 RepID=UPI00301BD042